MSTRPRTAEWEAMTGARVRRVTSSTALRDICETSITTPSSLRRCTAWRPRSERPPRASGVSLKKGMGREESDQSLLAT
ncbi:hypothetical protein D3C80_1218310 [compost metagenome]